MNVLDVLYGVKLVYGCMSRAKVFSTTINGVVATAAATVKDVVLCVILVVE